MLDLSLLLQAFELYRIEPTKASEKEENKMENKQTSFRPAL
jgi:hypothetical protein